MKNLLLRIINDKSPVLTVTQNDHLRRLIWQEKYKKTLKKFIVISNDEPINKESNFVFSLWFQGFENAPKIVKQCKERVAAYCSSNGKEFVELDENNLFDYVDLPETIITKWKNGVISNAAFSDICRVSLLTKYGGLWLDSTVYLTDKIDEEILESEVFVYQASPLDFSSTKISNWLMFSKYPQNRLIRSLYLTMLNFYEKNKKIGDYFIFHLFFSLLINEGELKRDFESIPFISNTYPHQLMKVLNKSYNEAEFQRIKDKSNIHKLTYKELDEGIPGTFYKKIVARELEE
ncbi:capsular polysaccharide synthesis protein [Streptococcus sp. NLN76]|uniref:capsular polysaccharide synthesis protein n=1 Tax=Streptococcus sp. NLN76 TaxID=2822800 RepID=UPI0018AA4C16|nr:capsular polysaccharide synthesis protein [Streptococcus sp. NLN76]MBF8969893.1 capsular polysaccharide synthesis protein [Streptococcus sp. NLN76]